MSIMINFVLTSKLNIIQNNANFNSDYKILEDTCFKLNNIF